MRSSGTQQPGSRGYSNEGYKTGDLKRHLGVIPVAFLQNSLVGTINSGVHTYRCVLKNLSADLTVSVTVASVGLDSATPIKSASYAPLAIRMQLTPVQNFPDKPPIFLREVFQDPTATDNSNHPMAMDCPFAWEFESVGDECWIDVTVNAALLIGTLVNGSIVVAAEIEYTGAWPYPEAVKWALSRVQLVQTGEPVDTFDTSNV